jgi:hypothetical protein
MPRRRLASLLPLNKRRDLISPASRATYPATAVGHNLVESQVESHGG